MTGAPDEVLAEAAGNGSNEAFHALFARYRNRVAQFVRWQQPGGAQAWDDVTQEIFLQVLQSLPRFEGRSSFRTWLYSLARNVCRNAQRRRGRRRREFPLEDPEARIERVADPRPDALADIETREQQERVGRAVSSLTPALKTVLLLRDWEELSYREIAEVLGIPVGTVRSRLFSARLGLAQALQAETTVEPGTMST